MSKYLGAIAISGPMAPTDSQDKYPTAYNEHIKGGWKNVYDSTERKAIPAERREEGIKVYEISTNKLYHLIGGIEDVHWQEVAFGQSGIEDAPNDGKMYYRKNNLWVEYQQAVDGADIYLNTDPASATVGGITAGDVLSGKTATEILDLLLHPYLAPAFTSFALSGVGVLEIGAPIPTPVNFTWGTSNAGNVGANSVVISENGGTVFASGIANDGSESVNVGPVALSAIGTKTYKIEATNSKGVTFSRTATVNWHGRIFYGESTQTSLDEAGIKALRTSKLGNSKAGTYIFNEGGYKYIAYPNSLGDFATFKDVATNMDIVLKTAGYDLVNVTINGVVVPYRVYRTQNILNGAITVSIT